MGIGSNPVIKEMIGQPYINEMLNKYNIQQYLAPANEPSVVEDMLKRAEINNPVNVPTIAQLFPAISNLSMSAPQTMNVGQGQFGAGRFLQGLPALQQTQATNNMNSGLSGLLSAYTAPSTYATSTK